ncbi:MAG: hypothetical protein ABJF10_00070 [Chthoniobacter sp.]|uniref:hypothetical protein n=1 Tax=Chthoniobacter sp. TaxID=2510640 RepID=UPI0032A26496
MKHSFLFAGLALAVAAVTVAAVSKPSAKQLTPQRVAEVNALSNAANLDRVAVKISGFPAVTVASGGKKAVVELIREFRYPTEFDPPVASTTLVAGNFPVTPTTPRAFETINVGWTITLSTKARGGLIDVYGVADFVEVDLVTGGYGALAGPILTDKGDVITPNKLEQPKSLTTTTRFHIFAVPGESYDVTLYRGGKAEKHTVTVTAE